MQTLIAFADAAKDLSEGDEYRDMSYAALFLTLLELTNIDDFNDETWLPEAHNEDSVMSAWAYNVDPGDRSNDVDVLARMRTVQAFEAYFNDLFLRDIRPLPANAFPNAIVEAIVYLNANY